MFNIPHLVSFKFIFILPQNLQAIDIIYHEIATGTLLDLGL